LLASDAPGLHPLRVAAIDSAGAAGEQGEVSYCIASRAPDNLSACDPKIAPPDAVVSIYWDADVDVDLRAVLPGGRTVDPKNPSGDPSADGGAALAEAAYVTRDSLAGCVRDGRRQEDLVFPKRPSGSVDVYAHLADACGRPGASFTAVVYEAEGAVPARRLVERTRTAGRLVMAGGAESLQPPLFVLSYDFPPASKP
jgi:hypothetical protein